MSKNGNEIQRDGRDMASCTSVRVWSRDDGENLQRSFIEAR